MKRGAWRLGGTSSPGRLRRSRRLVVAADARRSWAESINDVDIPHVARATSGAPSRDAVGLPSAELLALLRSAARRRLGQEPFDEQLLACVSLVAGHAVEMDTGEGKTLAGALAAAASAVCGRRVHVLSVNDYLAARDAEWMRPLFDLLDISVGWISQRMTSAERADAYQRDVVYAAVSEVGYDLLRDRFVTAAADSVHPVLDVAIVDEADAVMIDEAMSPLVLAGTSEETPEDFSLADALAQELEPGTHYAIDADRATVSLTDAGLDALEHRLGGINLYAPPHTATLTRINLALHARVLVHRDVDYMVVDDTITLINAARGRVAHQQRWPDGLHAAVEAKEQLRVSSPGVVLDTLTVQDLLLRYETLAGMSGTVMAVEEELAEFYSMRAVRIERRLASKRKDAPQRILLDDEAVDDAVVAEVRRRHHDGQPVLVGTQSVAQSEHFAEALQEVGIAAQVLNARNDGREAAIIAQAGEFGAVTISTQMSGRGTDIRLGGSDERDHERVAAAGGLAVLQVGRYPSQRLDAQLRGRAGRQGDPGDTLTFLSTADELVQANAPKHALERIRRRGPKLDQAELRQIVDGAQRIAEGVRRDRHRDTWAFSRAIALQRDTVLRAREEILSGDRARVEVARRIPDTMARLTSASSPATVAALARDVALWCVDEEWADHLAHLAEVRDGIHLRALAGMNPRDEFHRIALRAFHGFFNAVHDRTATIIDDVTEDQLGQEITALGLRRPSATWTYMARENPLGSPMDRSARAIGGWVRRRVYRME